MILRGRRQRCAGRLIGLAQLRRLAIGQIRGNYSKGYRPRSAPPRTRSRERHVRALEVHLKFSSHGRAQAVEELAEVQATDVVLKIARIEMVCDIENRGPGAHTLVEKGDLEAFQDLHIDRHKGWEAPCLVARTDEIQTIIYIRKRKAGSNFHRRRNGQSIWRLEFSVCEKTMGRVERQPTVLVRRNY